MEEIEVPTEHLHEQIKEKAEETLQQGEKRWTLYVAISTALMAVFAALGAMMAGHHSNEALIDQIKASDTWAYYQAKSIKAEIRALSPATQSKPAEQTKSEEQALKKQAEEEERSSAHHLQQHVTLARGVTFLQISIAIAAVSILTRKRFLWVISMLIAFIGLVFMVMGLAG
jgi:alpha-galactosidase/6-phospho-beta-glucosidase family protein